MAVVDSTNTLEDTRNLSITFKAFDRGFVLDMASIEHFYFIEDIFSHSMVGVLRFRDTIGFYEFAPLTGDSERLVVTYGQDKDIDITFDVYEVKEIAGANPSQSQGQNIIEIVFVDDMYQLLTQQKFSRSWTQESVSNIVKHITNHMLDIDSFNEFEESGEKIDFAMPYWYPKQAITWLCRRGVSKVNKKPGYLFYNNIKGTNFVTLDKLLQGSPLATLSKTTYQFDKPEDPYFVNKILSFAIQGVDNYQMPYLRGGFKYGYDFSTKSFVKGQYEYSDLIKGITVLGKRSLYSDIGTPRADYVLEGEPDSNILDAMFVSDWQKRYSLQQAIKIIVRGHEQRFAGDLIEIQWPSTEKDERWNRQMNGLYLVKSVTNQWSSMTKPNWVQKLVLIKNGYTDSRNRDLIKSTKKNIYGTTLSGVLGSFT